MRNRRTAPAIVASALALSGSVAAAADANSRLTVRGAGWGHGVGMSQYGAKGFAERGWDYKRILGYYYTGTSLGTAGTRTIRILLRAGGAASVRGATSAAGKRLNPSSTYRVRAASRTAVDLLDERGRRVARSGIPLSVSGTGTTLTLSGGAGAGAYRGAFEFRPSGGGGVQTVNAVSVDDYMRGVVARESPSSWPLEQLKAQAVAARSYALTTTKGGNGFDQYNDTRSQVYGGVGAETPATNQAVTETAGQVVTYAGRPVTTYYFSTSGGRTEDVENSALGRGGEALPWLRSVEDPYDSESPRHRWGPITLSAARVQQRLGRLVKGRFVGIRVIKRGSSPRIVDADVVGTRGNTRVTGADLRARLGLNDTWAYFTTIRTRGRTQPAPSSWSGLRLLRSLRLVSASKHTLSGRVFPGTKGSALTIQQRRGDGSFSTVGSARTRAGGRYRTTVPGPGTYRVRFLLDAGPAIRVG